ncbi:uncharacterized protein BT62DRAFT_856750, partial [Guyanagaster necrorhizus]
LPAPPSHLLNNSCLQTMLYILKDFIAVNTPFNTDCLNNILQFYPNTSLVFSVIHGLHDRFWPLDLSE